MKTTFAIMVAGAALVCAQEPGPSDRWAVPFSNPSGTKTLSVDVANARSITVRTHAGNDVIVEAQGHGARRRPREVEGLKRIDIGTGLDVDERDNVVTIKASMMNPLGSIAVQVPQNTNVKVKTMNAAVTVEGARGEVEASAMNGSLEFTRIDGSVVAHTMNGKITAVFANLQDKPMSFSTMNGAIDVTLPPAAKARLKLKTHEGDVYTDFDVKLEGSSAETTSEGGRRVRRDYPVVGTINGGGPDIAFTTMNGQIRIRKAK